MIKIPILATHYKLYSPKHLLNNSYEITSTEISDGDNKLGLNGFEYLNKLNLNNVCKFERKQY